MEVTVWLLVGWLAVGTTNGSAVVVDDIASSDACERLKADIEAQMSATTNKGVFQLYRCHQTRKKI